jgi:hypothetical protein
VISSLYEEIGRLKVELDYLKKRVWYYLSMIAAQVSMQRILNWALAVNANSLAYRVQVVITKL